MARPDGQVGRGRIWDELTTLLAVRRSAVVLLAGPPGTGRTHMLTCFAAAARQAGYRCDGPLFSLEPTTRIGDVLRWLSATIGPPAAGWEASMPGRPGVLDRVLAERDIFAIIEAAAPVVICVDGYLVSPTLHQWFRLRLIPRLHRVAAPVILAVADRPDRLAGLRGVADVTHELGRLDRAEVSEHLRTAGQGLRPELTGAELDAYSAAACADPRLVAALARVLHAAGAEAYPR